VASWHAIANIRSPKSPIGERMQKCADFAGRASYLLTTFCAKASSSASDLMILLCRQ
jgi:hypothetical protein